MKTIHIALTLLIAFFLSTSLAQARELERGIVTFTFDDALKSQLDIGLPLMHKYGFQGTLYASTYFIGNGARYTDWNGVRSFHTHGWEIGAHGHMHADLTKVSETELIGEMVLTNEILEREIGYVPESFASPYGSFNAAVLRRARQYYKSHVQAWGEETGQYNRKIDPYAVSRYNVRHTDTTETVCQAIELAARERRWILLAFHNFVNGDTVPTEYTINETTFTGILDCVARLKKKNAVSVVSVRDALGMVLGVTVGTSPN